MPTTTTTYSFNKPTVGGDEDAWGGYLNGNWDSIDDLLDGTTPVTGIDINSGAIDGTPIGATSASTGNFSTLSIAGTAITATAAELNLLDGVTATTAELNFVDGVTSNIQTQIDSIPTAGSRDFVASGAISNGDIVGLTSDGKVSVISTYIQDSVDFSGNNTTSEMASVFDSTNNKIVIAYQDRSNSNYGTAVVGTISGGTITFGTPVVFNSASIEHTGMGFDSTNGKVVIAYRDLGNLDYGTAIVGTVSGTSISFGSSVVFQSNTVDGSVPISVTFDSTNDKIVISYTNVGGSSYGTSVVGTVSGTSISFGTPVVFESAVSNAISSTFDSTNGKVVIAYRDGGNSNYGTAIVGTVSGTSISFGTPVVFESSAINFSYGTSCVFDSTQNKVIISFSAATGSSIIVGTVSGTSISFGTKAKFASSAVGNLSSAIDSSTGLLMINYEVSQNSYAALALVSGSSVEIVSNISTLASDSRSNTISYDSNAGLFVAAQDKFARVIDGSNLFTASAFAGIAAEAISDAATGTVTIIGGVNDSVTGLIKGVTYYLQTDGTLGGLETSSKVGIALDSNKLLITSAGS